MTPHSSQPHVRPRGFAIVSAIFILVVLAALGAFIVSVSTNQHVGSALDIQGVRAYQAARAGIEWGIYQVQATPAYNFSYGNPATIVGAASPNLRKCPGGISPSTDSFNPGAATLAAFTVTVTCTETIDGSGGPSIYSITATACNQPNAAEPLCPNTTTLNAGFDYIERRLDVSL
jgi:MSHA biogenesis protein MshP